MKNSKLGKIFTTYITNGYIHNIQSNEKNEGKNAPKKHQERKRGNTYKQVFHTHTQKSALNM